MYMRFFVDFRNIDFDLPQSTSISLLFPLKPEIIEMHRLGLLKYSDKTSMTFSFAFPSIGGTATRTISVPLSPHATSFLFAFGLTVILNFITLLFN